MSLRKAVQKIVDRMLDSEQPTDDAKSLLVFYTGQFMAALDASEGEEKRTPLIIPRDTRHDEMLQKELIRKSQEHLKEEESYLGGSMTELVGGIASQGAVTMVPVDSSMPVGAKTLIANEVYVMKEDRKLHFSEDETRKFRMKKNDLTM